MEGILKKTRRIVFDRSVRQLYFYLCGKLLGRPRLCDFDELHPCAFVLSTGRVGTQTLAALLDIPSEVFAYHEPSPKLYALSKAAYEYQYSPVARKILHEAFVTVRNDCLQYALSCCRGYIETSPQVTFLAPIIRECIPDVKFIHLVRDPRDVVRSGMRRNWYAGHSADCTRIVPLEGTEVAKQWDMYTPFQKNLWLWNETNQWILDLLPSLYPNQSILVHSEDVFQGSQEKINQIFKFLGLTIPPSHKVKNVLAKRLNSQKTGGFPKPINWSSAMRQDLIKMTGATAVKLGYKFS